MGHVCHPGSIIVLEYEIYGRQQHRNIGEDGVILLKPETREITVGQARVVQCMECNKTWMLKPQLRQNRG